MTDKECNRILAKAKAVQECMENKDTQEEWISNTTEKLEKLNIMRNYWIEVSGCIEEEGNTTNVDIVLNPYNKADVIDLVKEKLETEIQDRKIYISEIYERLNSLLK